VNSDRVWRWIWIGSILAVFGLSAPLAVDLYSLREARRDGDLPKSMRLVQSLSEGFFGPILSPWLDSVSQEIRSEVVESNLLSIQRLVPDSEESAYAELELGRLALDQGNATEAAVHLVDEQLAIAVNENVFHAKGNGFLQGLNQGSVFRCVVGRFSNTTRCLDRFLSIALDDKSKSCVAGVPAGCSINENRHTR